METAERARAFFAVDVVRHTDPDAEVCSAGDEWRIETQTGEPRSVIGVRVVRPQEPYGGEP